MRYLLIILLFACNDNSQPVNNNPGKKPPVIIYPDYPVIIPIDTIVVNGKDTSGRVSHKFKWPNLRPIGMLMFANWRPSAVPPNYRNWFLQGTYDYVDFKTALFEHINVSIKNLKDLKAQGVIIWDICGQKYPHSISYIGSPDSLSVLAPEMDSIADEVFKRFTDEGLKVGVCLRPTLLKNLDKWPGQFVDDYYKVLHDKILYAKKRWGCTLFYVDSNVGWGFPIGSDNTVGAGQVIPAEIFKELNNDFPDCLIIPEWQTDDYYKYTAPYNDKNYGYLIDDNIKAKVPSAFMVLNLADYYLLVDQVRETIEQGNIVMFRSWFEAPEINLIKLAYENIRQGAKAD